MIVRIDLWILFNIFLRIAWKVEARWGYSNFALARLCAHVSAVLFFMWLGALAMRDHPAWLLPIMVPTACLWAITVIGRIKMIDRRERMAARAQGNITYDFLGPHMRLSSLFVYGSIAALLIWADSRLWHSWVNVALSFTYFYALPMVWSDYFSIVPRPPFKFAKKPKVNWLARLVPALSS